MSTEIKISINNDYLETIANENPYGFINENNELICEL